MIKKLILTALSVTLLATVLYFAKAHFFDSSASIRSSALIEKPLPSTPEDVVRTWESEVALNHFSIPKMISTGKTLEAVVSLDSTNAIEAMPTTVTRIVNIACQETGDKAACDCILEDEEGQVSCKYFLQKIKGQWCIYDADAQPIEIAKVNQKPSK
jgi:hypothetical protein